MKTNNRKIYITKDDAEQLRALLDVALATQNRDRKDLKALEEELNRAEIVAVNEVPPKVVTMKTNLKLRDLDSKEVMSFTLVFPDKADVDQGRLSITSPVGTAVLGYSEGDTVEWEVPAGVRRFSIEEVLYQPEAQGKVS